MKPSLFSEERGELRIMQLEMDIEGERWGEEGERWVGDFDRVEGGGMNE